MIDYLSDLPVELIDKILDDVPSFDILTSLCLVNKRLRLLSLSYSRFQLDFSCLKKKKQFDIFCSYLPSISSQIVSISFLDRNDVTIPSKIDCFFSHINITNNTFLNLRSLNLSLVDRNMWKSIKKYVKSLVSLVSLSIDLVNMNFHYDAKKFISHLLKDLLFISPSLKYLCLRTIDIDDIIDLNFNEEQASSIEHLVLPNICINLSHIYSIAPTLRTLNMIINPYHLNDTEHFFQFEHLSQLSINVFKYLNFSTMKQLLHQMIRLVHLTIVAYRISNDMMDGFEWERILTNIITFKFSFYLHKCLWTQEPIGLESFSTPFWLKNKRWYVKYDRCTVTGFSLLYSTPYLNNKYPWKYIKGPIMIKSTGPQILTLSNVNKLTISSDSSINTEILCQFTELHELFICDTEETFHALFHDIVPYIDISKITTFSINPCGSKLNGDGFVRFVFNMSHLRSISVSLYFLRLLFVDRWSNINRLKIYCDYPYVDVTENQLTTNEINALFYSFNHLEYIHVYNDTDLNLVNLINNMPATIFSIVIRHPINVTAATYDRFITRDWLEQNTRLCNFFYSCNERNIVNVWF